VNGKTEQKEGLTYLSWTYAWEEVKKNFPSASYEIKRFGEKELPYIHDENTGYMVFTEVTIENVKHEMWLPVMDSKNKAMKNKPYKYKTKYGEKEVEAATMFDINKTIMRCLVKNLAMFGLGLYVYSGEDLPQEEKEIASSEKIEEVISIYKNNEEKAKEVLRKLKVKKIKEMTKNQVNLFIQEMEKNEMKEVNINEL
jgi:hypothetical protein